MRPTEEHESEQNETHYDTPEQKFKTHILFSCGENIFQSGSNHLRDVKCKPSPFAIL